jgi:hypothetical protein
MKTATFLQITLISNFNLITRSENGTWIDQATSKVSLLPLMLAENRDPARFGEEPTFSAQSNPNCSPNTSRGGNSGPFRKVEAQPGYNRLDLSLVPIQNRPDNYWGTNESPHIYMGGYVPGKSFVETGVFYNDKPPAKIGDPPRGWAPFMNIGGTYVYGEKQNSVLSTSPKDMLFLVLDDFDNNGRYIKTILNLSVYTNVNGVEIFYSISTRNTASVGNTPGGFRELNGQQILKRVVSIAQQVVSSGKAIPCETQTNKAFTAIIKRASLYYINFPGSRPYGDWNPKDTRMTSKITNYAGDYVNGADASLNYRTPDIPTNQASQYSKISSDKIYLFTGKK